MIGGLLRAWGVDPVQWRALVIAYLRMDARRSGGAKRPGQSGGGRAGLPFVALLTINAMTGAMLALLGAAVADVRTYAVLLTTYAAVNTSLLLLVDFTSIVVSPDDYRILGSRPVESRTYFAARLCTILLYVLAVSLVLSPLPAAVLWLWRGLGVLAGLLTVAAIVLCNLSAAVFVICGYAALAERVHPRQLTRALSYLQLAGSTLFLGAYYVAIAAFDSERVRGLSLDVWWAWLNPASWFASFALIGAGVGTRADWIAGAVALAVTAACAPLVAGRISLTYAERLAEISASSEPPRAARSVMTRLPGFSRGEARAVALLVRAQFRYDNRFRLAILSLLPVTGFYILIGLDEGALEDPFSGFPRGGLPMYFATVFLPMTIQSSLTTSDSWRAAWVFFATPADPAKLIVAAKNFVAIWFLGGYLLLLAIMWSFFFDRVWHAFVHALVIWSIAHLLLQAAIIARPALPFATEPQQAQRTAQLFGLFLVGGIAAGLLPLVLPFIYAGVVRLLVFLAFVAALTVATEYTLRLRAREAVLDLEFRS